MRVPSFIYSVLIPITENDLPLITGRPNMDNMTVAEARSDMENIMRKQRTVCFSTPRSYA